MYSINNSIEKTTLIKDLKLPIHVIELKYFALSPESHLLPLDAIYYFSQFAKLLQCRRLLLAKFLKNFPLSF